MSYLLEALRKSERERQQKTPVPGLQTPTVEWESGDEARARSPWLMVAVLAICLNTILVAVLVWRFGFADAERAARSASTVNDMAAATAQPVTAAPAMPPVIVVQQPREPSAAIIVRERGEQAVPSTLRTSTTNTPTNMLANSVAQRSGPYETSAVTSNNSNDRAVAGRAESASPRDLAATSSNTGVSAGDSHEAPSINALPQEVRQQLPMLTMNSHIYANNARDSFVLINGVSLNPGDEISAGLKLVAVVPEGAILIFNGQRFLLPALASFSP